MPDSLILYTTVDGRSAVNLFERDGSVWLEQSQMAELFATSKQNVSLHIKNILRDRELDANSVVKDYLTTAADGKKYSVKFYSLEMIMTVGFRVRSVRGVQFRQWANHNLTEYLRKGFVIDDERLKNPDGRPDYFDKLLARFGISGPRKSVFIRKCATCSYFRSIMMPPTKQRKCFLLQRRTSFSMPLRGIPLLK